MHAKTSRIRTQKRVTRLHDQSKYDRIVILHDLNSKAFEIQTERKRQTARQRDKTTDNERQTNKRREQRDDNTGKKGHRLSATPLQPTAFKLQQVVRPPNAPVCQQQQVLLRHPLNATFVTHGRCYRDSLPTLLLSATAGVTETTSQRYVCQTRQVLQRQPPNAPFVRQGWCYTDNLPTPIFVRHGRCYKNNLPTLLL